MIKIMFHNPNNWKNKFINKSKLFAFYIVCSSHNIKS